MKCAFQAALCAGALVSCVHVVPTPDGPEAAARAYADALEQGRLDDAFRLSAGVDPSAFKACYAQPGARQARVSEVRAAAGGAPQHSALRLVADGAWKVEEHDCAPPEATGAPAAALTRFLDAVDRADFTAAREQLAPALRARYSAERFKDDFDREPLAKERVARARMALTSGTAWNVAGDEAVLTLAPGKAVRLKKEAGEYRVVAIE
jgi:hypothetical protein